MQWLRNLPVSRKFIAAFGIVCGLCIVLGVYTFVTYRDIAVKNLDVSDNALPAVVALADIRGAATTTRREDLELLLCQTAACSAGHNAKRLKALASYQATVKVYEPTVSYPGERELYQKFSAAFSQYADASNRVSALAEFSLTKDDYRAFLRANSFRDASLFKTNDNTDPKGTFNGIGPSNE